MYFDAFTISALVDEFMDTLVGGRVQDSINVDPTGIGLEIYADRQRRYLYLSADKQTPRVHLVDMKLRRGVQTPSQLSLLFRRYVEGGIVAHVSQPPWERVMMIDVEGPEGEVTIVIEPMERRSNLLLLRDGVILDCVQRVGPEDNRYRISLPNHRYIPPPPMKGRLSPFTLSAEDVTALLEQNTDADKKAHRLLTSNLYGFSPLLARELAADVNPSAVQSALADLMGPLADRDWQPGLVEHDGAAEAFSVYPITHKPGWQPADSVSAAISAYYGGAVGEDAYNQAKVPVREALAEARIKLTAKLNSLERGLKDDSEREALRQRGELILAYQYQIEAGQTELQAPYDPDLPPLMIQLDPELTPLENAQRYFDKYNRAKRALNDVPGLIEQTQLELRYIEQLGSDLELASNWPEIDEVIQALQSRGLWQKKMVKRMGGAGQSGPMKITTDGYVIWIGRNSRQNELATFKHANSSDLWLHARDVPGAHVIIRDDGRHIPEDLIERAAAVAAYYSSKRSEGAVTVDVTRRKHVRKIKGAGPGMVSYSNERTVTVQPQSEEVLSDG